MFRDLLFALFFNYVKQKHESKSKTMPQDTFSLLASPCLGNLVAFNLPFFENIDRCISIHISFLFYISKDTMLKILVPDWLKNSVYSRDA